MNIIGLDELVFGVDDVGACAQFLTDYGLQPVGPATDGGCFEALDGTAITIRHKGDPALPAPLATATMLRKTVYGVADEATLHAIADELGRDRTLTRHADGSLETVDDVGFVLGFQVTRRRSLNLPVEMVNAPGAPAGRPINVAGAVARGVLRTGRGEGGGVLRRETGLRLYRPLHRRGSLSASGGHAGSPHVVPSANTAVHARL
jgi:hypothetical protein